MEKRACPAAGENGYGKQLANGALIGLLAGVGIFAGSWILVGVVSPDSMTEMQQAQISFLDSAPLPEDQKQARIAAVEGTTVSSQALSGLMGTFFTSAIIAAIVAIFQRRK